MTALRWRVLRIATGLLLLVLVLAAIDLPALGSALARADLRAVVLGVAGLTAIHVVPAAAWRAMVRLVSDVAIPWSETLEVSYAAQAVGGVTPANLGGDLLRAAAVRGAGHGLPEAIVPIVVQRATSYLALALLSVPALVVLAAQAKIASGVVAAGIVVAALVVLAAWLLVAAPHRVRRLAQAVARRQLRVRDSRVEAVSHVPRRTLTSVAAIGVASGIAFHAGSLLLTWLLLIGVDPSTATLPILATLAIARLSLAVPLTPSGVGIQEAVVVTIVASLGGPTEAVLAGLLLARLGLVSTTLIGTALVAVGHGRLTHVRAPVSTQRIGR